MRKLKKGYKLVKINEDFHQELSLLKAIFKFRSIEQVMYKIYEEWKQHTGFDMKIMIEQFKDTSQVSHVSQYQATNRRKS